jgi:hypothetical protein
VCCAVVRSALVQGRGLIGLGRFGWLAVGRRGVGE